MDTYYENVIFSKKIERIPKRRNPAIPYHGGTYGNNCRATNQIFDRDARRAVVAYRAARRIISRAGVERSFFSAPRSL